MADLTDIQAAQSVKIIGADTGGVETTPLAVNTDGSINTINPPTGTTGSLTSLNSTFDFDNSVKGYGSIGIQIAGTWVGTVTASVSVDGTNFSDVSIFRESDGRYFSSMTSNDLFVFNIGGVKTFRLTMTAYTSGTASIGYFASNSKVNSETVRVVQNTSAAGVTDQTRVPNIPQEHQKIHEQKMFFFSEVSILGGGVTRYYLFTPTTFTAHWVYAINSQDGVALALFELASLTGVTTTTTFTSFCKARFGTPPTAAATIKLATVVPALSGPLFDFDTGSATNIQKSIQRSSEWDLGVGKFYILRVTSNNASNTITTEMEWYEN